MFGNHLMMGGLRLPLALAFGLALAVGITSIGTKAWADGYEPETETEDGIDPLEGINRVTHNFNLFLRDVLVDPLVDGYQAVTPEPVQEGLSNAVSNLTEPLTIVGSALQGDTDNAGVATERFIVNTTVGVGGFRDAAGEDGLEQRREDLGQAAAKGGVGEGAYIVLPIFGPTTARDAAGDILFSLINPFQPFINAADSATTYSENQDVIKGATEGALDSYTVERDLFLQRRSFEINNGEQPSENAEFPSLSE